MALQEIREKLDVIYDEYSATLNEELQKYIDANADKFQVEGEIDEDYFLEYQDIRERVRKQYYNTEETKALLELELQAELVTEDYNTYPYDEIGNIMSIDEFVSCVKMRGFMDHDGFGVYMTSENAQTDLTINLSAMIKDRYRKDMPYVNWYNK